MSSTPNTSMKPLEKGILVPEMDHKSHGKAETLTTEPKEAPTIDNKKQRLSDLFTIVQSYVFSS